MAVEARAFEVDMPLPIFHVPGHLVSVGNLRLKTSAQAKSVASVCPRLELSDT